MLSEISNFGWNILKARGRPQFAGDIAREPENYGSHLEASGVVFQDNPNTIPMPLTLQELRCSEPWR